MLQRFVIHIALVLLFAFTQMGVATHEIRHVTEGAKHGQQDQHNIAEKCEQCLNYAKVANGLTLSAFVIPSPCANIALAHQKHVETCSQAITAYSARAPPQKIST
ncbi:MAG: hypothetical protein CVU29_03465 [Betaproteobacteria bacterium HGW-Betaproteobacteria-22]|nr:MAG: hypothetical protein CVU29_03465 [Betaproteobacteria bacterium HGW-Betaproteobacteria-22]